MNPSLTIPPNTTLFLRVNDRKETVSLTQVVRLQSDRNYTILFLTDGRQIIMAKTIGLFEQMLPSFFIRIHRSHIVNFEHVSHCRHTAHYSRLVLKNGQSLDIAQRRWKWLLSTITKTEER
ncbi:LytTR family DNA-binding domain-containing protein [Runella sp.]|jgi:two-component system LytT family response regulator|uniref:LytR/AlgR family response regulator transcription factor n=1 Tax=Runella sp. TaxID=1960881 RepID=UPI00301686BA